MSSVPLCLTRRAYIAWRVTQTLTWLLGLTIVVLLVVQPELGLIALWNILIPVAPALLVFAPGLWRNVCPLGISALAARHIGLSTRWQLTARTRVWLHLMGLAALLLLVLLRRLGLNTNGLATAAVLLSLAVAGMGMGMVYEWKSGWCSGLCPVFAVEKFYGSKPLVSFDNAHCHTCQQCCSPCPDCTKSIHPLIGPRGMIQRLNETLLVGGFAGYVWGWFHVPDSSFGSLTWQEVLNACALPFGSMAVTLLAFALLRRTVFRKKEVQLVRLFAAITVSCYYWYRVPALVGFGPIPNDGVLIDLQGVLPEWWVVIPRVATTCLFVWWLVIHRSPSRNWLGRPTIVRTKARAISLPVYPAPADVPLTS